MWIPSFGFYPNFFNFDRPPFFFAFRLYQENPEQQKAYVLKAEKL
tara:strand:+ start:288 stop:422 length:135 start_codon:yes stop_codon:yes gene_type:complete